MGKSQNSSSTNLFRYGLYVLVGWMLGQEEPVLEHRSVLLVLVSCEELLCVGVVVVSVVVVSCCCCCGQLWVCGVAEPVL